MPATLLHFMFASVQAIWEFPRTGDPNIVPQI